MCEHMLFSTDATGDCSLDLRQLDAPVVFEHISIGTYITGDCFVDV